MQIDAKMAKRQSQEAQLRAPTNSPDIKSTSTFDISNQSDYFRCHKLYIFEVLRRSN